MPEPAHKQNIIVLTLGAIALLGLLAGLAWTVFVSAPRQHQQEQKESIQRTLTTISYNVQLAEAREVEGHITYEEFQTMTLPEIMYLALEKDWITANLYKKSVRWDHELQSSLGCELRWKNGRATYLSAEDLEAAELNEREREAILLRPPETITPPSEP